MTSIFDTSFLQNLERVGTQSRTQSKPTGEGQQFAKVLADVERPEPKPSSPKDLSVPSVPASPANQKPISNLSATEAQLITSFELNAEQAPSAPETSSSSPLDMRNPLFRGVKLTVPDVKGTSPVLAVAPPKAPEVLSVQLMSEELGELGEQLGESGEISDPPTAPPAMPEIASVERGVPSEPALPFTPPHQPQLASARRIGELREDLVPGAKADQETVRKIIAKAGLVHGIDPSLGMAVAQAESSLRTNVVSRDGHGSKGLFQLLDSTGHAMKRRVGLNEPYNPFDASQNTFLGVGYLRRLHDIFSVETNLGFNMKTIPVSSADELENFAVAAFNAGEGNVARAQARAQADGLDPTKYDAIKPYLPASTRQYVARVAQLRDGFDGELENA